MSTVVFVCACVDERVTTLKGFLTIRVGSCCSFFSISKPERVSKRASGFCTVCVGTHIKHTYSSSSSSRFRTNGGVCCSA